MIRRIAAEDKKDVLHISENIWEGDDYISQIFDEWARDKKNLFIGYWRNGHLIGFARLRYLTSKDIWLEALRKDTKTKFKGIGKHLTIYFFNYLRGKKIDSVRFSTYFGNIASIKLNEQLGFTKIKTFSLKTLELSDFDEQNQAKLKQNCSFPELAKMIETSDYLSQSNNFLGQGWIVQKYSKKLLEKFYQKRNFAVIKIDRQIKAAILFSQIEYQDVLWISFLEAKEMIFLDKLLQQMINFAKNHKIKKFQMLVPPKCDLFPFLKQKNFYSWEREKDFLLYELSRNKLNEIRRKKCLKN